MYDCEWQHSTHFKSSRILGKARDTLNQYHSRPANRSCWHTTVCTSNPERENCTDARRVRATLSCNFPFRYHKQNFTINFTTGLSEVAHRRNTSAKSLGQVWLSKEPAWKMESSLPYIIHKPMFIENLLLGPSNFLKFLIVSFRKKPSQ